MNKPTNPSSASSPSSASRTGLRSGVPAIGRGLRSERKRQKRTNRVACAGRGIRSFREGCRNGSADRRTPHLPIPRQPGADFRRRAFCGTVSGAVALHRSGMKRSERTDHDAELLARAAGCAQHHAEAWLEEFGSLGAIARADEEQLHDAGLPPPMARRLKAAAELGRRLLQ